MSVMGWFLPTVVTDVPYVVAHPLDDIPEQKVDTSALGPMPMTASVKLALLSQETRMERTPLRMSWVVASNGDGKRTLEMQWQTSA